MALQKNYSTRVENIEALKVIAASLGFVQTRGPHRGEGSIRRLLDAIAAGEVEIHSGKGGNSQEEDVNRVIAGLEAAGLIEPCDSDAPFKPFEPLVLPGHPLSEQIIADRR